MLSAFNIKVSQVGGRAAGRRGALIPNGFWDFAVAVRGRDNELRLLATTAHCASTGPLGGGAIG